MKKRELLSMKEFNYWISLSRVNPPSAEVCAKVGCLSTNLLQLHR